MPSDPAVKPGAGAAAPAAGGADGVDSLILSLDGFEGPLDLLLDLARAQKVDLARISILALVDQYLAIIEGARKIRLELAADWLVMAAWLAWLKSRLLLPVQAEGAEEGVQAADVLAARLAELECMRAASAWLSARPQLKHEVFARGAAEDLTETDRSGLSVDMPALLRGYIDAIRRVARQRVYAPRQRTLSFWTVQDAMQRLSATLGRMPEWSSLEQYLPGSLTGQQHRAAMASTLIASLELARGGGVRLRQDAPFAPILISNGAANEA
jgi:segregation and condensation protein A